MYPVVRTVAALVSSVRLQSREVQNRVSAHQALQFCGAEEVHGWAPTEHHEASCKRLKLHAQYISRNH